LDVVRTSVSWALPSVKLGAAGNTTAFETSTGLVPGGARNSC
jgi:hypothetical protein